MKPESVVECNTLDTRIKELVAQRSGQIRMADVIDALGSEYDTRDVNIAIWDLLADHHIDMDVERNLRRTPGTARPGVVLVSRGHAIVARLVVPRRRVARLECIGDPEPAPCSARPNA